MTAHAFVTRRMLLRDMGKAGVAVMVLGTAACSSDVTDNATPTPDDGSTSSSSTDNTTSVPPDSTASTDAGPTTTESTGPGHRWQRANLGFVSAYILYRGGEAALVDTGVEGSEGDIESALAEIGLDWGSVGHVIITHRHPDHQGSLDAVIGASDAPWYAGVGDIEAINATTEGTVVATGDNVFDLRIIETPGHTPGHVSVLDDAAGILVAGDALNGADGGVIGPDPDFSEDMEAATASVFLIAGLEFETILFGHGEPVIEGGRDAVTDLAFG